MPGLAQGAESEEDLSGHPVPLHPGLHQVLGEVAACFPVADLAFPSSSLYFLAVVVG